MPQGQRHKCGIDLSRQNFLRQMRCISMGGAYRTSGKNLFVKVAEGSKYRLIHQRSTSEPDGANISAFNRYERIEDFIAGLQQELSQDLECDSSIRGPDTSALHLAEETNRSVLLELSGLNAEIGLRGTQLLRSRSESLSLQDRQQISEMAKLGPFIHNAPLDKK